MRTSRLACYTAFAALALLPSLASAAAGGATPRPALELAPCRLPNLAEEARCGVWEVFEDREARAGRKIPLRVVVLPATGGDPAPDPLFFFAGGPGGSAVGNAPGLSLALGEVRHRRDLVLIDVRGTGDSAPLRCPHQEESEPRVAEEALESFLPIERLAECRAELAKRADLRLYTTVQVVGDVEEVRAALGYARINLMGGSYGTRPVQVYLRRHPEVVRAAILEGVVPMDARLPLALAADAQAALDALFAECAADADCRAAFPDPAGDLAAILERLAKGPVGVEVIDGPSGARVELRFSRNVFIQTLRYLLYNAMNALQVPAYLRAGAKGDYAPLGQAAHSVAGATLSSVADGFYLSVTCTEDVAWFDEKEAAAASAGTFLGDFRWRQQKAACGEWVRGALPEGFLEPVRSDIPVLLLTGERDPVTPAHSAEAVARHLQNSLHLVIPDGAHGSFGLTGVECANRLTAEFLEAGSTEGLDVEACRAAIVRPPFLLALAADDEVEMSEAELRRLAGVYVVQGRLELVVELADGRLRSTIEDETMTLIPVAPARFKIEGAPPGTYLEFATEGERVTSVELLRGGNPMLRLDRRE